METDKTVTINGVGFSVKQLTNIFPNSYFDRIIKSGFRESSQDNFHIGFPVTIDCFGINGTRYLKQIAYRLKSEFYQYPGIRPESINTLMPEADGDRFISFDEMYSVIEFLLLPPSEKDLVEDKPIIVCECRNLEDDEIDQEYQYEADNIYHEEFLDEDIFGDYEYDKKLANEAFRKEMAEDIDDEVY